MIVAEENVKLKRVMLDPRGGRPREKSKTYIEGLDRILNGGIPIGNTTLLAGTVGSGKTTLAMEYLINGAKNGETTCYISVTEASTGVDWRVCRPSPSTPMRYTSTSARRTTN